MNLEQLLKQIRLFADNIATLASDVSDGIQKIETTVGDVSSILITAKDTIKVDMSKLQDNLSTIGDKVQEYFEAMSKQDDADGHSG